MREVLFKYFRVETILKDTLRFDIVVNGLINLSIVFTREEDKCFWCHVFVLQTHNQQVKLALPSHFENLRKIYQTKFWHLFCCFVSLFAALLIIMS